MPTPPSIIFFDGVCNFCNYWAKFAIKHNRKKNLLFSPLQGQAAKEILPKYGIDGEKIQSVIFIDNNRAYTGSSASLRICKHMSGGWKLFYGFMIVPKFIRDFIYGIIARNRYKWFGKKEECMVPTPELRQRFLN